MATSEYLQTLASYVPRFMVEEANRRTEAVKAPTVATSQAAVLFVDVSGFTALTERLAERGTGGAEDLAHILNSYFGDIIDAVVGAGGDIVKFAGDALLCLWQTEADAEAAADALHVIASIALDLQKRLHHFPATDDIRLSMKLCVSVGTIQLERLGGVFDRWELLVAGTPLGECGHANDLAEPGQVVVTPAAVNHLNGHFHYATIADGYAVLDAQTCSCLHSQPHTRQIEVAPLPAAAHQLRQFIPGAIRDKLESHQADWLNELRTISVVFVNLPEFSVDAPVGFAHRAMRRLQTSLYRFEGSINKISVDDKGASLLCVLGLPPFSHDDDPGRAVRAALVMEREMKSLGLTATFGITTGRAFCGTVGNDRRREYSILGNVVNLAARLMVAAKGSGGLLSDGTTYRQAKAFASFQALDPITVKGRADPLEVWKPSLAQVKQSQDRSRVTGKRIKLFGRDAEIDSFKTSLAAIMDKSRARGLALEGRVGTGKSRIMQAFNQHASEYDVPTFTAAATTLDQDTPYAPMRQLLDALFDIGVVQEPNTTQDQEVSPTEEDYTYIRAADSARFISELPDDPDILKNAPLFARVMSIDIPDNETTTHYSAKQRLEKTTEVVGKLLIHKLAATPVVLLLKDIQNLDSASWQLLLCMKDLPARLLMVASVLEEEIQDNNAYHSFVATEGVQKFNIGALDRAAAHDLICQKLGAKQVPDDVLSLLYKKSQGVPLFLEELALTLRESGEIEISDGIIYATVEMSTLDQLAFSTSLRGAIISRIDRLPPAEQMTLKVASVCGRTFEPERLAEIHPITSAGEEVTMQCVALDQQGFTPVIKASSLLQSSSTQHTYKFKSGMVQQVAYELLLFAQRRQLHAALAQSLERDIQNNPDAKPNNRLLAYHLEKAAEGDPHASIMRIKAARLYSQLANEAAAAYSLDSAFSLIQKALGLVADIATETDPPTLKAELELELKLLEGRLAIETGGYAAEQAETAYNRARQLADDLGNYNDLFFAMRGLWQLMIGQANYPRARRLGREILAIAHAANDSGYVLEAHRIIGSANFWFGDFRTAHFWMLKTAQLFDPKAHGALAGQFGQDPDIANRGFLAWVQAILNDAEGARKTVAALLERADRLNHPFTLAYAHGMAMWTGYWLRDPKLTADHALILKDLGTERGFVYLAVAAEVALQWGQSVLEGDTNKQHAQAAAATIEKWRQSGNTIGVSFFLTVLIDLWLRANDPEQARTVSQDPLLVHPDDSEKWYVAHYAALTAEAMRANDETVDGIREFVDDNIRLAEKQGARVFELDLKRLARELSKPV